MLYLTVFTLTATKNWSINYLTTSPPIRQKGPTLIGDNEAHSLESAFWKAETNSEPFNISGWSHRGKGGIPQNALLSDFLTPFPLSFLCQPGVVLQRAREWEQTGKNTLEQQYHSTSCFPFALPVSFPVWSVQPVDQSDVSFSVHHG